MQAVLIIPARFASTRFPGKPLVDIDGKPMIQRVYERAALAKGIDAIYVATDDQRIKTVVEGFGGQAVMTNPDAESGTDRLEEAAQILNLSDDTLIINLQGDQPLANPECIERLVTLFKDEPNAFEMATLGVELHGEHEAHNPNHVKLIFDNHDYAIYFSRANIPFGRDSQDFPMYKHLGIYAYTRGFLAKFAKMPTGRLEMIEKLEQLRALENGYKIKVAIGDFDSPEVDVPSDIDACLAVLKPSQS